MRHSVLRRLIPHPAILVTALLLGATHAGLHAAEVFVDIDGTNTAAVAGTPSPFYTDSATDTGFTSGSLWRRRTGFGFDRTGHREIFEKDANGGIGDAAALVTTVSGLTPGTRYGVYVAFLSVASENWQVKAGITAGALTLYTPSSPAGDITDLGLTSVSGSNRHQYLGFVANITVPESGVVQLYSDDGDGTATNYSTRSWLEGFLLTDPYVEPPLPGDATALVPDGAWTWFNDERTIVHQGSLYIGYVTGGGQYGITRYDLTSGQAYPTTISTSTSAQQDDHDNPSITELPDGRLMVLYSKHLVESRYYQRTSLVAQPSSDADWGSEIIRTTPASNTYADTFILPGEGNKIYNFHRCINFNPTLSISTDLGATWGTAQHFISTGTGGTIRPYTRFTSNHYDRIDVTYTDGHPRDVANSLYHLYYQGGFLHGTDGGVLKSLDALPLLHDSGERGTVIYQYHDEDWSAGQGPDDWIPTGRAWNWDVSYDHDGNPVCVFQVQRDEVTGTAWSDDRIYYYYARWTGAGWQKRFIAQAGRPIYSSEDDYGGGMCLDPEDPRIVYISTIAAEPFKLDDTTNVPLASNGHFEIWRGFTADGGLTFTWTPITSDSSADNLRPIIPENHGRTECVLWFYGTYSAYTSFSTRIIGRLGVPATHFAAWAADASLSDTDAAPSADPDGDGQPNLLEYALGSTPTDAASVPSLSFDGSTLQFPIDRTRNDLEWQVEESTDLATWQPAVIIRGAGLPETVAEGFGATIPDTAGTVSVAPPALGTSGRLFLRLSATTVR